MENSTASVDVGGDPSAPIELEERTLYDYLLKGYLNHNNLTFIKGVTRTFAYNAEELLKKEKETDMTVAEAVQQIKNNITEYLKNTANTYKKPMLLLSSGLDSNIFRRIYEKNIGPLPSVTYSFYKTPYDEYELLKSRTQLSEINHVIRIYDDVLTNLSYYLQLTGQPISGLPSIAMMKAQKFAKDWGADVVISGVEDAIWFASTMDIANEKMKAEDSTKLGQTDFLTDDFRDRVKTKDPELNFKSKVKKGIFEQFLFYKSPKVIHDFNSAAKATGLAQAQPYLNQKNIDLVLSLRDDVLHFDNKPKSLIDELHKNVAGKPIGNRMLMVSPQRELVRTTYRESIINMINKSRLAKDGFVDKKKLLSMFKDYCKQKGLGNSFFIWKFITAEIWYSLFFYNIKKDLYPTYYG